MKANQYLPDFEKYKQHNVFLGVIVFGNGF